MWPVIQSIILKKTKPQEVSHVANDSIHHTERNKTPVTALDTEAQLSFLVGEHINVLGGWGVPPIPQGEGIGALHLGPSQNSPCASCLLLVSILYNKTNHKSSAVLSSAVPSGELSNLR